MPRRAVHSLADRSGSDSDDCMFDQTNLLQRRRLNITRLRRNSATISGQRLTVARTVNLCLSFFALGLCFVIPTATINGLQYRTASSEDQIDFIYTARYGGYIVGCFAGGFLFNCYNRQFLLFIALLATAIGVLIMPFCRVLSMLMTCTCVTGVTMGLLDTGGNVWLLDLWGRKSAPFMQMMHFCFGLGALVAPLVAQPFIHPYSEFGTHLIMNGSRSILPPLGPHLSSNPHPQHLMKRDLSELSMNLTKPILNATTKASASVKPEASAANTSFPLEALPKKPHFADSKKLNDVWERKPPVNASSPSMKTTLKTASSNESITSNMPPVSSFPIPRSNEASGTTVPATSSTTLKPTPNLRSSAKAEISEKNASIPSTTTSIPASKSSTATVPSQATKAPQGVTRKPAPTITTQRSGAPQVARARAEPASSDVSRNESGNEDSTMKTTSSTVPTQSTVAAKSTSSESPEDTDTVLSPPKHHSIKKVLPEEDQEESWIEQARRKIQKSGKFEIAYAILAAYVLLVSIVFLLFLCLNPREAKSKQEDELDDLHQSSLMRMPLTLLMCIFFFLYMGVEVAVGETLKSLQFHQDVVQVVTGEQLIYIFWGSFAFARGVSIFVSMSVSCRTMLIFDIVVCMGAAITLVVGAQLPYVLIAGIVVLGSGMASIIPTSFIWLERHTQVTNRLSALLILSAAVGEMVIPELVSAFVRKTPMALMYVILAVIVLCSINLAALCYVMSKRGEKYMTKPDRSLYQLASLDDDQEQWNNSSKTQDGVLVKRNKTNSFFYDRLNNLDG